MPPHRRRGPYKQYLIDPAAPVPRSSQWYREREENQLPQENERIGVEPGEDVNMINMINIGGVAVDDNENPNPADIDLSGSSRSNSGAQVNNFERLSFLHSSSDSENSSNDSTSDNSDAETEREQAFLDDDNNGNDGGEDDINHLVVDENFEENIVLMNVDADQERARDLLYEGAQISTQESDMLIMSFIIRWGVEDKCIEDLLRLIDCHMPASFLGSKYLFLKKFPSSLSMQVRYFCPECNDLMVSAEDNRCRCSCNFEANVNDFKGEGNFFVQLSVSEQIQNIMSNDILVQQMRKECRESDVTSGKVYRRLRARGIIGNNDITLQWNTDGVKPFKSSKVSFYPIQACVNELPLQTRRDNMLLCGLYYGKGKPDMNVILKPFVDEMRVLHREGIECTIPGRGEVTVRVHTFLCSVDSVARPALQGIIQYNGRYGCSFCLRRGKTVTRGRGRARVYIGNAVATLRSVEQHVRALETLEHYNATHRRAKTHIQGVKRGSVLLLLPLFNIIKSFVPDYMHAALEGVVVTFWKHWSSSEYEGMPWHLTKHKRQTISKRLEKILPPVEITRVPRSLDDIALWKASEIKSFLLYYSLPCLKSILPNRYLKHWFLLVYSITVFIRETIVHEEFSKAEQAICKFVEDISVLYPNCPSLFTFNTHLLLHFPKAVENFGGLWASSTFPYEHFNGVLTRLITGTQSVPTQVCRSYLRLRHVTQESSRIFARNDCSEAGKRLYQCMLSKYHSRHSQVCENGLRLFGAPEIFELSLIEKVAVEQLLGRSVERATNSFRRMIIKGKVFHASVYRSLLVRDNSIAQTTAGLFIRISRILLVQISDSEEKLCVALCNEIQHFRDELCRGRDIGISSRNIVHMCHRSDRVLAIFPTSILYKCVGVPDENYFYVVPLANSIERD